MAAPKLTDDDRRLIAARQADGETMTALAKEYGVAFSTIKKAVEKVNSGRVSAPGMPPVSITDFRKRARKILWRVNPGKDKVQYDRWEAMIKELKKEGKISEQQAVVQASKSFDALKPLFATCDVSALDPQPGSHADITHYKKDANKPTVKCLKKKLTNRENLAWAIETAGKYLSERIEPEECPNWVAYYLFNQARSDNNNFTGKYLAAELKLESGGDPDDIKKAGKRSVKEINEMLEVLNQKAEESKKNDGN